MGADNGIGLSMALAILESNEIVHGPIEVMTTTNEDIWRVLVELLGRLAR